MSARRRDLVEAFALPASDERWVVVDLLVGTLAFLVWVAGSGAIASQVASTAGVSLGLAAGEPASTTGVALLATLWVVVPAIAFVVRLRQRMLNIRGNVQQYYRLDHPAALLALPTILAVAVAVPVLVVDGLPWYATLALVPVGLFALVRTLAFSYRVYSFSRPLVVQVAGVAATAAMLAGSFLTVAVARGRRPLAEQALSTLGVSPSLIDPVALGNFAVPGPTLATLAPILVAAGYVLVQTVGALLVRLARPAVDRSKMRTGQRYPPFLESATPTRTATLSNGGAPGTPSAKTDSADATTDGTDDGADADESDADATGDEDDDEEDAEMDDVSNTRVFTPPADGEEAGFDAGSRGADEANTETASTAVEADARTGGETRAVTDDAGGVPGEDAATAGREHCDACGESFSVDTAVRFCPNCGAALEGE